jgi:apoptosis-inducing factor 2
MLLNSLVPDKYRRRVEQDISEAGANIIKNDALELDWSNLNYETSKSIATSSGKEINSDLIVSCMACLLRAIVHDQRQVPAFGGRPATDFLKDMGDKILTSSGYIRVTKTLQLPGYPNIFAAGDAIESKESRQILQCNGHAAVIAKNILAMLNGAQLTNEYKGSIVAILISNGRVCSSLLCLDLSLTFF